MRHDERAERPEAEARVARLVLYLAAGAAPLALGENEGPQELPGLLDRVRQLGIRVEVVDTAGWDANRLNEAYRLAIVPAIVRHTKGYSVRRIFGSRRRSATQFARGVPALLVYREGMRFPADVFPHEEEGRVVTIRDFLRQLLEGPAGSPRGTLTPETVRRLERVRRRLAGGRRLPDDSVEIIRAAREGR